MSKVFDEDLQNIIADKNIPWENLRNTTVLVTGATGLIGTVISHTLAKLNTTGLNIKVLALGRNAEKGEKLERLNGVRFIKADVSEKLSIDGGVDYIFHCAANTKSADMVAKPVEIIETSLFGMQNVLKLAVDKKVKSLVYLSSMEVYGQIDGEVRESDLGYLDLSSPRSSYPESKRMCENLLAAYFRQYACPGKAVRLALTYGASSVSQGNTRVCSQFAKCAMDGADIVLHTDGGSVTNCVYTADAVRGLFAVLLKGENGNCYNLANPATSMTIREMAEVVANVVAGGRISVVVDESADIGKFGYAPKTGFALNVDKLKSLGWSPQYDMPEMYRRLIADRREGGR
jgi:nucleoside-diphosphate-sugar epimerase